MPTAHAPPRSALWGLWAMFTAAAIGFAVFLAGLLGDAYVQMLAGAAFMVFATLIYLFIHFWNTAHATLGAEERPEQPARRRPVRAELARPRPTAAPAARGPAIAPLVERSRGHATAAIADPNAPGWDYTPAPQANTGRIVEHNLVAAAAGGETVNGSGEEGALGRMLTEPPGSDRYIHATKRRHEIVRGLPLVGRVFEEEPREPTMDHPGKPGMTRGRCSGCNAVLWAPAVRPVRLRCPHCHKTKWLDA